MIKKNHRSVSEQILQFPKLTPSTRIGPTTFLQPPQTVRQALDSSQSNPLLPALSPKSLHPNSSSSFIDSLIDKYKDNRSGVTIDFVSTIKKAKPLIFMWSIKSTYGNIPASRVGGTMTPINNDFYLFGGQSGERLNDLRCLNYETLHWSEVQATKDMESPEARDGHTMLAYKQFLVLYGGAGGFDAYLHIRTCSPLIHLFDTQTLRWKIHKPQGRLPDPRRNHGASLIGNTMLIYGGINNNNETLSDIHTVNLDSMQWLAPKFSKDSVLPGLRNSFTITSVFHPSVIKLTNIDMFSLPPIYDEVFNKKNTGFYVFGGMNQHGEVLNDLYVIQIIKKLTRSEKNLMKAVKIEGLGRAPIARYGHSAGLCGGFLVIVGGRNDKLFVKAHQSSVSEVAALNLAHWRWEVVDMVGVMPRSYWGVACAAYGSKLMCFGGMNLNSFSTNEFWAMETSQESIEGQEVKRRENPIRIIVRRSTRFYE